MLTSRVVNVVDVGRITKLVTKVKTDELLYPMITL
jgi:hypothetical protein